MIYSFIHPGSGLGNQLFRIVACKVMALDKGYEYSAIGREYFKGTSFMNIDFGALPPQDWNYIVDPSGKIIIDDHFSDAKSFEEKTNYYNPEVNFIEDNTVIDGEFQDPRYFEHRIREVNEWLKVEPVEFDDNLCVIGFRGGEYTLFPDLFLPPAYWQEAIQIMKDLNPHIRFEVHTDDPDTAGKVFINFPIIHDIGVNWRSIRSARYAIIANSSFFILPRLLKHADSRSRGDMLLRHPVVTIAPRYWARRNIKEWSMPSNFYKSFQYI